MGKLVFRSVKKSRKRIISVSVSDDVLDFLDKQANKSQYICDLVKKAMNEQERTKEQEPLEPTEPELPWTDEMNQLWTERRKLVSKYGRRFTGTPALEGVYGLEARWIELKFGDSGYVGEEKEFSEEASKFESDVLEYFEKVLNLPSEPNLRGLYLERVEKEQEAKRQRMRKIECGGDPEETMWRDFTRWDIVQQFEKDKHYTVHDVAGELGISYDQAYKNIVPFLKARGFKVG